MVNSLLDSNYVIYIAQQPELLPLLSSITPHYNAVSAVEALGYNKITMGEMHNIQAILDASIVLGADAEVINQAIQLRQRRRMSLGDAIVAATALVHDLELWTHNTKDFTHIPGLRLRDPLTTT